MMKTYDAAPMDKITFWVTVSVFVLLAFFAAAAVRLHLQWASSAPLGFMVVVIILCWQAKASRYEVGDSSIRLVRGRPYRDIVIPLADVREVTRYRFTLGTIRTFGVGGLFSSTGLFWNKELGRFFATVTNLKNAVLITDGKKFVISPENPDEFIAEVQARLAP
jgi:hypothetical protein